MALAIAAFGEGILVEEAMWQVLVLIPKGKGDYRCSGLLEVMWKVVAEILNLRLTASITYHNFLRGFWSGEGTGTVALKAELI